MEKQNNGINLNQLTAAEYLSHNDSFKEYSQAVLQMLKIKDSIIFEDELIKMFGDDSFVKETIKQGKTPIEAIKSTNPDRFFGAGRKKKAGSEEFSPVWFDIWSDDYFITPKHPYYDLFFAYKLRQTDILAMDDVLNDFLEDNENANDFIRFLKLTLRKHGQKLLQPEQLETINEWLVDKEKEIALLGTEENKTRVKIKRTRDDKVTSLNQEQTALLAYCFRETKVILPDEFLNNKETGLAFSILTGYSADTIRQNLKKTELVNTANAKNIEAVEKALKDVLKYIEKQIKPE